MRWYVRSTDELHPDIELKPNDVIALGRSPETGISDRSISRLHTLFKFQPAKEVVLCKQVGRHSAIINGGFSICLLDIDVFYFSLYDFDHINDTNIIMYVRVKVILWNGVD